jgi:hypothetical protein
MNEKSQIKFDITNPEWTTDEINRAIQFNNLSTSLQKSIKQLTLPQQPLDSIRARALAD